MHSKRLNNGTQVPCSLQRDRDDHFHLEFAPWTLRFDTSTVPPLRDTNLQLQEKSQNCEIQTHNCGKKMQNYVIQTQVCKKTVRIARFWLYIRRWLDRFGWIIRSGWINCMTANNSEGSYRTRSSRWPPPPAPRTDWSQSSPASRSRWRPRTGPASAGPLRTSLLLEGQKGQLWTTLLVSSTSTGEERSKRDWRRSTLESQSF